MKMLEILILLFNIQYIKIPYTEIIKSETFTMCCSCKLLHLYRGILTNIPTVRFSIIMGMKGKHEGQDRKGKFHSKNTCRLSENDINGECESGKC